MAKGTTTQTTNNEPWKAAQPYLTEALSGASAAYKSGKGFDNPSFSTVVPYSADTTAAQNGIRDLASQGNPFQADSASALHGILGGQQYQDLYNSASNPAFEAELRRNAGIIGDNVGRQFSAGGRYGSGAQANAVGDQVGNYVSSGIANNWNQNIANQAGILGQMTNAQLSGISAVPGVNDANYAPYDRLAGVGSQMDDLATRTMQDQLNRFQTDQQKQWNLVNAYGGALSGGGAQQGGTSTTTTTQPPNVLGRLLGGGGLLASLFGG